METWLLDNLGLAILVALALIWKLYKPVWGLFKHTASAAKTIHETDKLLAAGYKEQSDLDRSSKDTALRSVAQLKVKIVEMADDIELREEVNRRDRMARRIYLKHLKGSGADIIAIEKEIRTELERTLFEDASR